jgi:hypothetical protein
MFSGQREVLIQHSVLKEGGTKLRELCRLSTVNRFESGGFKNWQIIFKALNVSCLLQKMKFPSKLLGYNTGQVGALLGSGEGSSCLDFWV